MAKDPKEFQHLIGKTVAEANIDLPAPYYVRVVNKDGHACVGTCDYVTNRINIHVRDNRITEIKGCG